MHLDKESLEAWEDAERTLCEKYSITPDELKQILCFAFGESVQSWYHHGFHAMLLDLPNREVHKAIRRIKPKLAQLPELIELRKEFSETGASYYEGGVAQQEIAERSGSATMIKKNGVWIQKD